MAHSQEYIKVSQSYAAAGLVKLLPDAKLEEAAMTEPLACVIKAAIEDCDLCLGDNVLLLAWSDGTTKRFGCPNEGAGQIVVSEPVAYHEQLPVGGCLNR